MKNLKRINEEISRTKKLMNIKEYAQAYDNYSNVDFKDLVVGRSKPSQDAINPALLQDVQTAAKNAGVKVDITTAVSGHGTDKPTRHTLGNAVDVAIINGKSVSSSNRGDADKFVAELTRMGYVKNREVGNPKAVLTFGFPGHDNHVHVSNTSGSPVKGVENLSEPDGTASTAAKSAAVTGAVATGAVATGVAKAGEAITGVAPTERGGTEKDFLSMLGHKRSSNYDAGIGGALKTLSSLEKTVKEEKVYSSFGRDILKSSDNFKLPQNKNNIIKSPIDGIIENYSQSNSCKNQISIKHIVDKETHYLEYCGIDNLKVSSGDRVSKGTKLGETNSDVTISLYGRNGSRLNLNRYEDKEITSSPNSPNKPTKKKDTPISREKPINKKDDDTPRYRGTEDSFSSLLKRKKSSNYNGFSANLFGLPFKVLSKAAKSIKNKIPILKDLKSVTSKKVNEDIERIKRLLK